MSTFKPFSLDDKVAIVTGASKGIGEATSIALAKAGADLVLASRKVNLLKKLACKIEELGRNAIFIKTNVSEKHDVQKMVDDSLNRFGRIDILVNNAAVLFGHRELAKIADDTWVRTLDVNLKGPFFCSRAVAPIMIKARWGRIVNIASIAGQTGGLLGAPAEYSASKGGLISMAKSIARDLAPYGITVNTIAPGLIETEMSRQNVWGNLSSRARNELIEKIPLNRIGKPDDIAYAVLYLASEEAGYITGATLDVNGGLLKR